MEKNNKNSITHHRSLQFADCVHQTADQFFHFTSQWVGKG